MKLYYLSILILLASCNAQTPLSEGDLEVFFCHETSCVQVIQQITSNANSCRCAFYNLDINLSCEHIVVDQDAHHPTAQKRTGKGLMHHKFCVINDSVVLTGSFNPTSAGSNDYNNMLIIHSTTLAQVYTDEFNQLLRTHKKASKNNHFIHNNYLVEFYACPQDDCQQALLRTLSSANNTITFALFTFTDKDVSEVIRQRINKGVKARGVVESWQSKQYEQYSSLTGAQVYLLRSSVLQHNKVWVIDSSILVTGSYNPTKAAHTINDESLLIIHNEEIAHLYESMVENIILDTQTFK